MRSNIQYDLFLDFSEKVENLFGLQVTQCTKAN